jgi:hypothetical protein
MTVRLLIAGLLAAAAPAAAHAQSRLVVAPSLSLGFVYDDNVFYETAGNLEAIWRVTPGVTVTRETQRSALFADLNFDLERFREHPSLSTPLARQYALVRLRHLATPRFSAGFEGGVESTRAPAEMNLTTGLLTGRRRAMRIHGGPSVAGDLTPRLALTGDYSLSADIVPEGALQLPDAATGELLEAQAPASRLWTHVASSRLSYDVTPRHEFRLDYVGRWFVFGDPTPSVFSPEAPPVPPLAGTAPVPRHPIVRHTAFAGWTYRINPAVTLDVAAGPRFRFGRSGDRVDFDGMEIEALLSRQRLTHDVFLSYVRTVTSAIGLTSLMDTDRGLLRAVYRPPFGVHTDGEVGVYRSTIDDQTVTVVRVAGGLTLPLGGPVSLGVSYALDSQYGRFGPRPLAPIVTVPGAEPSFVFDPDAPMRRGVALIRLIIAPTLRPTPEDPPPGATPVRRPPGKRSDR